MGGNQCLRYNTEQEINLFGFLNSIQFKLKSEQKDYYLSRIPMSRFGKPVDIANTVFFLASDESSYITGQNFHVNGGMLMV